MHKKSSKVPLMSSKPEIDVSSFSVPVKRSDQGLSVEAQSNTDAKEKYTYSNNLDSLKTVVEGHTLGSVSIEAVSTRLFAPSDVVRGTPRKFPKM